MGWIDTLDFMEELGMLVLGRKENQSIIIGDNIRVTVVGRSGSSIRIGVQAPREIRVLREEVQADPSQEHRAGAPFGERRTEDRRV
jgi:carbon storage regulator